MKRARLASLASVVALAGACNDGEPAPVPIELGSTGGNTTVFTGRSTEASAITLPTPSSIGPSTATGTLVSTATSGGTYTTGTGRILPATITVDSTATGAPVSDAVFTVVGTDAGVQTTEGPTGTYVLFGNVGSETVQVSAPGYASLLVPDVVVGLEGTGYCLPSVAPSVLTVELSPIPDAG